MPGELLHSRMHIPALDGVRGVAILLVLLFHSVIFSHIQPTALLDRTFVRLSEVGWAGVDLFFVLSGFLITGILYDAKGEARYFRNFYARRILRIFPLYYGVLCFLFLLLPRLAAGGSHFSVLSKDQIWYWTYLINVPIGLHGWPPILDVIHFWSLAVEEQFYMVWPWIVFALGRRALMLVCVAMAVASFFVRVALQVVDLPIATTVLTPAKMDALAVGSLLALIARDVGGLSRLQRWVQVTAVSSAILLAVIFFLRPGMRPHDPVVSTIGFTLVALFFGSVLALTITPGAKSVVGRFFAHPILRSLGRYSYALYIFHLPVIFWLARHFNLVGIPRLAGSNLVRQLLFTTAAGVVSLAAAVLSWHLYEAQFLKLKSLFPYGRTNPRKGLPIQ